MIDEMTVNNRSIKEYNARLLNFSVGGTERSYSQSSAGSILRMPSIYHTTLSPRRLSITLTFFPKSYGSERNRNRSIPERLMRSTDNIVRFETDILNKVVEIGLPDGYIYKAYLQLCGTPSFDATGQQDIEYTFFAIRTKPAVKQIISSGGTVYCESNTITPFRLSCLVPQKGNITICDVSFWSVEANSEIVMDSELGIVTANGNNIFAQTTLIDFPYLNPGVNTITCSVSGLEIAVIYTPVYA